MWRMKRAENECHAKLGQRNDDKFNAIHFYFNFELRRLVRLMKRDARNFAQREDMSIESMIFV